MTAKHTPGPWRWLPNASALVGDHGIRPVVLMAGRGCGGLVERNGEGLLDPIDTDGPNARLIAAAPALLEALKTLLDEQNGPPLKRRELQFHQACEKAIAAIAQAEGVDHG